MPSKQRQSAGTEPVVDHFDGEGFGYDRTGADRPRTSQAHGRHAANAVIAATSNNTGNGRK